MKTALLLIAHGSPLEESNEAVLRVLELVRASGKYDHVQPGYLDCNRPDIPTAVQQCVDAGAGRIICVPHFLHAGRHVALDLPRILAECQAQHPAAEILLAPLIGCSPHISTILLHRARHALADN